MTIKTQLTKHDFVNVNLLFLYARTATKIIIGFAVFMLLAYVVSIIGDSNARNDWSSLIAPVIIISFMPLSTYLRATKAYSTNPQARESVIYDIEPSGLQINGETYSSSFAWKDIHKVSQHKNWLLIWQSNTKIFPISLTQLWGGQIAEIKDILDSNGVKNNLKYLPS